MRPLLVPPQSKRIYAYFEGGELRSDWKTLAKQDAKAIGQGAVTAALIASTFIPIGRAGKYAYKGYRMYRGSKLAQVVRTVKRPITSTITRLGYSSKPETGVRVYGVGKALAGIADPLATTRAIMRGEFTEAAVTFYGPPFAGHAYRRMKQSLASSSSPSQQNGGAKGKKNRGKTKTQLRTWLLKHSHPFYTPKSSKAKCRKGYYRSHGLCVKK